MELRFSGFLWKTCCGRSTPPLARTAWLNPRAADCKPAERGRGRWRERAYVEECVHWLNQDLIDTTVSLIYLRMGGPCCKRGSHHTEHLMFCLQITTLVSINLIISHYFFPICIDRMYLFINLLYLIHDCNINQTRTPTAQAKGWNKLSIVFFSASVNQLLRLWATDIMAASIGRLM